MGDYTFKLSDVIDKAQKREAWYKRKLMTRNEETGLNMN